MTWERLEERVDERAQAAAERVERKPVRTGFGWFVKLCLALVVLSLLGGVIFGVGSWVSSWGGEAKRIVSPTNVREQYRGIIEDWQGMEAAAANACNARSAAKESADPTLVEDPTLAYKARYRQIRVDYNRRQANLFEGREVGPKGYPRTAPTLEAMQRSVC